MKRKIFLFLIIFTLILPVFSAFSDDEEEVKEVVKEFCNAEFNGIQDKAIELARVTDKTSYDWKKIKEEGLVGRVIDWDTDPIFIIASYEISNIKINGNKAIAEIKYIQLARTEKTGANRKIIADPKEDHTKLILRKKQKWLIMNPPPARISKDALIKIYQDNIASIKNTNGWFKNASESQLSYYKKLTDDFEIIKNLKE
jgi:hypothetical protein